jgi:hypothetical protein
MRRPSIPLGFLMLVWASSLAGQVHPAPPVTILGSVAGCPVELTAEQAHDGALSLARSAGTPAHAEQVIDLSIRNSRLPRIVGAEIEVHGTSPRGRIVALESASGGGVADAVRAVHLQGSVPPNEQRTHRLSVPELTSVQWIDVIELRYADGSAWHEGAGQQCRVEPDPILRIASTQ